MTLVAAEHISRKFNAQIILDDVSFSIQDTDRIGLVGKNGIGKTTLLEMLAGKQEPDSGSITHAKACLIEYVEQEKDEYLDQPLFDFVAAARQDLLDLRAEIVRLEHHLEARPHDEESLQTLGTLQQRFESQNGHTFENEISTILLGLGFASGRHQDPLAHLSGGEKNRAGLARLLAGKGNLLLLDEPTNHLDIESTMWLEGYLRQLNAAYLLVSHDRAFLNNTVDQVWEIGFGKIDVYHGGFDKYVVDRDERKRLHEHRYRHQQEEIKRLEDFVRRNMAGQKTRQAQSKLKYLARIERIPPPKGEGKGPLIRVESSGRSFNHVLAVEDLALGYDGFPVVQHVAFDLYRGDKVGLIGRNGSGKSTILKALLGELSAIDGSLRLGSNVDVAYFDQELSDLNLSATVVDNLWELDPTADVNKIKSFLARFGFTGEASLKATAALSGGEKTKLCLARLLYYPANFIILDEPTNHLDIDAREALEEALRDYEGTLLIVSHDRYFLDSVVNRILHIDRGQVRAYNGNYSYFRDKSAPVAPTQIAKSKEPAGKQTYLDFKEQSRKKSKHKREVQSTRSKIADLERELSQLEADISLNIPRHDWEALQSASHRKGAIENQLIELMAHLESMEGADLA